MSEVITLGETMAAVRAMGPVRLGGPARLSTAGSESNVAIGLARLGHRVEWIGITGDDELGELVVRTLRAEGVTVSRCRADKDTRTGLVVFERRVSDITRVIYYRNGSAGSRLGSADVVGAVAPSVRFLHLTGITPALGPGPRAAVRAAITEARAHGIPVSFDVNYRRNLWEPHVAAQALAPLMADVDLLFASQDELAVVAPGAEDPVAHLRALGIGHVVVKHGEDGASVHCEEGEFHEPAVPVRVVDTIGAGDALVSGYLSGALDGQSPRDCLRRGVVTAGFAISTPGDWEGLPTRRDLALLATEPGGALR